MKFSSSRVSGKSISATQQMDPTGYQQANCSPPHEILPPHAKTLALALGALGVVFGDIGTSPLYAIKECFHGLHGIALSERNILGVLSLVFWSLTMVVSVKYVAFILRADNKGEGGIYALLALIPTGKKTGSSWTYSAAVVAGILGAALLYGDGIITPAISVL
jgi:KUP system potassium uptake protein